MKNKWLVWAGVLLLPLILFAGGKPNPGTKKDMRLARNNPNASKPKPKVAPWPKKGKS